MASTLPHESALDLFASRVSNADTPGLEKLLLFGSVARNTHRQGSDIDILAIIDDEADEFAIEERLRKIAYDVMLEEGAVFSIHGVSSTTLEERGDHPFFRRAVREGKEIHA